MKKSILILIVVFVISLFNVYSQESPSPWARNDVEQAISDGYVPPKLEGNYQKAVTREEFCELAVSLLEKMDKIGVDISQLKNPYCDTENIAILILDRIYIVDGKDTEASSGKKIFDPYASLTREEASKILNLLMERVYDPFVGLNEFNKNEVENATASYNDNSKISDWAKEYVGKITVRGMMKGVENNNFDPQGIYSVEQAIVTMSRIYNYTYNKPWSIEISNELIDHTEYKVSDVKGFSAEINRDDAGNLFAAGENVEHLSEIGIENDPRYGGVQFRFTLIASHMLNDEMLYNLCREMCTYNYMFEKIRDNTDFANEHMKIYINGELKKIKEVRERSGNNHKDFYFLFYDDINPDEIITISVICK